MILLSDEEIMELKPNHSGYVDFGRESAKAQLKKVAEWGNSYCQSGSHGSDIGNDMFPIPKRECEDCWQALLEEVKE